MTLQDRIQNEIAGAMKNRAELRLSVLRMMKTAIKNKEVEKMKALDENEAVSILKSLVKQRKDSVEQFRAGGREDLAAKEEAEIRILGEYLPAAASDEEIQKAVEEAVQETGAASMKDMGKAMKAANAKLAGKTTDGAKVSQLVKQRLQGPSQ